MKTSNTVTEWCSLCEYEVELAPVFQKQTCPHCKEEILPCAQCENHECDKCPLERHISLS
ncbi:hypothetical protein [Priestia endophytica]|uniref:Replication restart DNA helicase PriA n=1 Tax=Priestia endophytica DSM 13796 TaxID=1121089 RepID=A0A1I6C090_9BACI|nr:hypothetical protein [Priestia endophytica]KYG33449.1 hypothetical protein AZF06_21635 [Priestia endophytica]SFQ86593.1 hypothetical protein SAMN02745910_04676 [Priestia endophytica DSM 13796]